MKRFTLTIVLSLALWQPLGTPVHAQPAPADPLGEKLFAPDLIMQYGEDIGLTDEQRQFLMAEMNRAQERFTELHQKLQKESEATAALLKKGRVDEAAVLAQFDKMMDQERVIKRTQLALMLTLRNKLTPEQQTKLQEIKKQVAIVTTQTGRPPNPQAAVMEKMKKVEAGVQKWIDEGRDPAAIGELMQGLEPLTKQGKFKSAEELLDQALKLLEAKPKKSAGADPNFPVSGKTAAALQTEIEALKAVKPAWRGIAWKSCLIEGLKESREKQKPVLLWVFIDRPIDDARC